MLQKSQQAQPDPYSSVIELRKANLRYEQNTQLHTKVGIILLMSLMLLLLFTPFRTPFYFYDEGFAVLNATRVIQQEAPYRDFWAIYPPGQLYTLAAIFKTFGAALLVSRVYDTIVRFALVLGVYFVARKITSEVLAVITCIAATLLMTSVGFYAYAVYPALALSLWGVWSSIKYVSSGRRHWLFAAGILTGISSFYRWDIGLYASISVAAAVFLFHFFNQTQKAGIPSQKSTLKAFIAACKNGFLVFAVSFGIILIGYGWVSLNSGISNVWEQVVLFPGTKLREVRWRAYPSLIPPELPKLSDFWDYYSAPMDWVRFYIPLAVFGIALVSYAHALLVKRIEITPPHFGTIGATLFGILLFAQALNRYDYIHVLPSSIMASLVIVSLFSRSDRNNRPANYVAKGFLFALLPILVAIYFTAPLDILQSTLENSPPWGCYSRLERASCALLGENQQKAVEYVRATTQEGEPIYVGNQRHDYVFVNDVGFYFLANRPSATRYSELHPGVATTLQVQKEIAGEIESKNVRTLVLVDIGNSNEPNASAISSGIHYLDDFIRSKFSYTNQYGEYQIWKRKP